MNGLIYMEDATIMGWELMNEPRCQVDSSGNTVNVTFHYLTSLFFLFSLINHFHF